MSNLLPAEKWDYGLGDVFHGLAVAMNSRNRRQMLHLPGLGECIPARSARAALVAGIRALALPPGSSIAVPLYCCPVVFKAIVAAGAIPRFVDVDEDTYCMSVDDLFAKRREIDAIIAVHMFGNVCDLVGLQNAVPGKPVIEDCAQSLGSLYRNRPAGSYGTVAAFSFRSGKYLSVGEGGALFSPHNDIRVCLSQLVGEMPSLDRIEEYSHVALTYIRSKLRSRPLYGLIGQRLWKAYNKNVDTSAKTPIVLTQMHASDLALVRMRLRHHESALQRQRAIADHFTGSLAMEPQMLCREKEGTFYNRYLYPILFPSLECREFVASFLHHRGFGTMMPYSDIAEVATSVYGYRGDCPISERIAQRVLVIPSYSGLTDNEIGQISDSLNDAWAVASRN